MKIVNGYVSLEEEKYRFKLPYSINVDEEITKEEIKDFIKVYRRLSKTFDRNHINAIIDHVGYKIDVEYEDIIFDLENSDFIFSPNHDPIDIAEHEYGEEEDIDYERLGCRLLDKEFWISKKNGYLQYLLWIIDLHLQYKKML